MIKPDYTLRVIPLQGCMSVVSEFENENILSKYRILESVNAFYLK